MMTVVIERIVIVQLSHLHFSGVLPLVFSAFHLDITTCWWSSSELQYCAGTIKQSLAPVHRAGEVPCRLEIASTKSVTALEGRHLYVDGAGMRGR
jgi:hypothetical protein